MQNIKFSVCYNNVFFIKLHHKDKPNTTFFMKLNSLLLRKVFTNHRNERD